MRTFGNHVRTGLLLFVLTGFALGIGYLIAGQTGLIYALILAAIMNFVGYFFSGKIALMTMRAQEAGPESELYQIVADLARRAGLPMPRVYVSPMAAPNAFATGRNPKHAAVCATEGLLRLLDRQEIAGVMAHELAHVKHRDILIQSVAATIAGAITVLGYLFMFGGNRRDSDGHGGNPLLAMLFLILGPIAAGLVQAAISRQREYAADTEGGAVCGNPMYLASALKKIHHLSQQVPMDTNPAFNSMFIVEPLNAMESIAGLFATHPPLEKRLVNLIGRETLGAAR